jgi:heterodisulfide reductase subunit C2
MPIHEKSLIRPENLIDHEHLVHRRRRRLRALEHLHQSAGVTDYNEAMQEEIAALAGRRAHPPLLAVRLVHQFLHRQRPQPDFNPRYWIYLIRIGMEEELLRDKDIIWQCVSCNKCTYACPRDVNPEGVMKATAHWLELKGHTPKSRRR